MAAQPETLRRTPLFDRHKALGAKLVPFAGWEMPVQYTSIREEHQAVRVGVGVFDVSHMGEIETRGRNAAGLLQRLVSNDVRRIPEGGAQYSVLCRDDGGIREEHVAVRTACGVFDVSHMGEIETSGPQAFELLQRLLSNDVSKLAVGAAQYSVLCREDGGVLDDLFTYRTGPDRFLTVTNAANHDKDLAWFQAHAGELGVEVGGVLAKPGQVGLVVGGVGDRQVAVVGEPVGEQVVEDPAVLPAQDRVLGAALRDAANVVGEQPLEQLEGRRAPGLDLAHVGDVEHPARGSYRDVLRPDALVLNRHLPARERHHPGAGGGVRLVQRRSLQRRGHRRQASGARPSAQGTGSIRSTSSARQSAAS